MLCSACLHVGMQAGMLMMQPLQWLTLALCIQDRSCQYADAGEHGCLPAALGCFHHEARTIPLVAGTLSGVAMFSKNIQRKCDIVPNAFCTDNVGDHILAHYSCQGRIAIFAGASFTAVCTPSI